MRNNKVIYGLLAFAPILLFLIGFALPFLGMFAMLTVSGGHGEAGYSLIWLMLGLQMIVTFVSLVLHLLSMVMYLLHIMRNGSVPAEHRIYWILGVVLLAGVGHIVYYMLYILPKDRSQGYPNMKAQQPWD